MKDQRRITDARWWDERYKEPRDRAERVTAVARDIWESQSNRRLQWLRSARLYGDANITGLGPRGYSQATAPAKLAFNVIRSCCDAYTAKVSKDNPKVTPLTTGGDWELQEQAKALGMACEGLFYDSTFYGKNRQCAADTAKFGTAWVKITTRGDDDQEEPNVERVFCWEMLIDDEDAAYGEPRTIGQYKYVDRSRLIATWPEHEEGLRDTNRDDSLDEGSGGYMSVASDQLLVVEMWHLPSSTTSKDGLRVVVCGDMVLEEQVWTKPRAPFESLVIQQPTMGVWGTSIAVQLERIQEEICILLQHIQLSHRLLASGHWLVANGSKVNTDKLNNFPGSVINYTGTEPRLVVGQTISPEVYQHLDRLYGKAFEISGISQLSASGLKPAGLDSGEAQRVYLDTQTERFKVAFSEYQDFHLRVAKQLIDVAGEVSKRNKRYAVKVAGGRKMTRVVLSESWLDDENYILKLYPTNAFSDEPAAKIAEISKMVDSGLIAPEDGLRELDYPDTQGFSDLKNASYNLTRGIIDDILHGREYVGPEPFMNLPESIKLVQQAYVKGLGDKAPVERLNLLPTWIQSANDILHPPPADIPAAPAPPGAPPMPDPNAPPPMPGGPGAPPGLPPGPPPPSEMGGAPPQGMPPQ